MMCLELHEVSYHYPDRQNPALDGVSLRLARGQFGVLLGCNGSGKSTLAKVAAGLLRPQSGRVEVSGGSDDGDRLAADFNPVRLLFQNPDEQILTVDVEHELAWGLENLALPRSEIEARVRAGLRQFDLIPLAHQPPEALSDGQKQLVALAALVVMRPEFLLLDEAAAFLDQYWRRQVGDLARSLARDAGVLWISTRSADAAGADMVWLISDGRITASGSPADVLQTSLLTEAGLDAV